MAWGKQVRTEHAGAKHRLQGWRGTHAETKRGSTVLRRAESRRLEREGTLEQEDE